jgi:hypothetical protein
MSNVVQKKVKVQKVKPVAKATPVIRKPKGTDGEKISVTRGITSTMQKAPQWNASPDLQAAATAWNTAADVVENNAKVITAARNALAALEATQRAARQDWKLATRKMTATVAVVSEGSPDTVHLLGFDVFTHVAAIAQEAAPSGLVSQPGSAPGEAVISWQKGTARHGFLVQRATDPANAGTYSAAIPCTRTKYVDQGEKSATVVYFRVAAIDPTKATGLSPWSDWVSCTVR